MLVMRWAVQLIISFKSPQLTCEHKCNMFFYASMLRHRFGFVQKCFEKINLFEVDDDDKITSFFTK